MLSADGPARESLLLAFQLIGDQGMSVRATGVIHVLCMLRGRRWRWGTGKIVQDKKQGSPIK